MPMTDSRLVTAARLQLTRPGPLLWAFGMALSLLTTLLSGPGSRDEFAVASYLLGLLLFAGVLGGEPSRSLRRWLSPARWSPGRLLAVAFGARAAALVGGFLLAAALLATAGSAAPVALVARTVAVLLAGAAWVTLFSWPCSCCRAWQAGGPRRWRRRRGRASRWSSRRACPRWPPASRAGRSGWRGPWP
jgi:hypothetical protein